MNKNSPYNNHEIDLIEILRFIWADKLKIIFITVIFFLVGIGYNYKTPNLFSNTLIIKPSIDNDFLKFIYFSREINYLHQSNQNIQLNELILQRFLNELTDYKELVLVLKNYKNIKESVSKLNEKEKNQELFKYSKLLVVNYPDDKSDYYSINFKWNNPNEARDILQKTINLTLNNIEKSFYEEIETIINLQKRKKKNDDLERLIYLTEQTLIAKELDLPDNQVDNFNLSQSNVSFSINANDVGYYLRGYRAIDKEIDLIRNRKYQRFNKIEKRINHLKEIKINWIDHNIYLMETKSLKKSQPVLIISVLLGLIFGIFYTLISNALSSKIVSKKSTK